MNGQLVQCYHKHRSTRWNLPNFCFYSISQVEIWDGRCMCRNCAGTLWLEKNRNIYEWRCRVRIPEVNNNPLMSRHLMTVSSVMCLFGLHARYTDVSPVCWTSVIRYVVDTSALQLMHTFCGWHITYIRDMVDTSAMWLIHLLCGWYIHYVIDTSALCLIHPLSGWYITHMRDTVDTSSKPLIQPLYGWYIC